MFIAGCSSHEKNVYQILETTVVIEADFEQQQQPMNELEVQEKKIFDQIMEIGLKEHDEVKKLADEAINNLEQRKELLDKEKESLQKSEEEFKKAHEEIEQIRKEEVKEVAQELEQLMNDRFAAYYKMYDAYVKGLEEDKRIYEMLKNENVDMTELEKQIAASNEAYQLVQEYNILFNEITEKFNNKKIEFYEAAGFQIVDEEKVE